MSKSEPEVIAEMKGTLVHMFSLVKDGMEKSVQARNPNYCSELSEVLRYSNMLSHISLAYAALCSEDVKRAATSEGSPKTPALKLASGPATK